jgi:hypothetical protein
MTENQPAEPRPGQNQDGSSPAPTQLPEGPEVSEDTTIAAPQAVDVPLPPTLQEQIAIPASINGRDLSKGRP